MDSTTDEGIPEAVRELIAQARAAERETRRSRARCLYEAALRTLDRLEHPTLASAILRLIGRTHYQGRNLMAAMDCFEAAFAVAEANGDVAGQAQAVNGKGIVEQMRGNLQAAADHFTWSLERALTVEDENLAAMIHQNLGVVSNIQGDFAEALRQYRLSKEAYDALGEDDRVGPILNNIGHLHTDLGEWTMRKPHSWKRGEDVSGPETSTTRSSATSIWPGCGSSGRISSAPVSRAIKPVASPVTSRAGDGPERSSSIMGPSTNPQVDWSWPWTRSHRPAR